MSLSMRLILHIWLVMLFFYFLPRERERGRERVRRFIKGLAQPIRFQMAKETRSEISF